MSSLRTIRVESQKAAENVHALRDAMAELSRATNTVPVTRIEWLVALFIASQTVGNVGTLLIAIALLKGHP